MERLRYRIRRYLDRLNGRDIMDRLNIVVFDDKSIFDGASTSTVREHFKNWVDTASQQEQGTGPANSQRYRFCIQVNSEALEGVIHDASAPPLPDATGKGFVIEALYGSGPVPEDDEPPIEGCTLHNVGWMRIPYQYAMTIYCMMREQDVWYREYRRPPEVVLSY